MEASLGIVQIGDRYFMATAVITGASVSDETIARVKDKALALTQTLVEAHKAARPFLANRQITMVDNRGFHVNDDLIADHNFDLNIAARTAAAAQLSDFNGTRGSDLYDRIQDLFLDATNGGQASSSARGVHVQDGDEDTASATGPDFPRGQGSEASASTSPFSLRLSHLSKAELGRLATKALNNRDIPLCIRVYDMAQRAGHSFPVKTQKAVEAERRELLATI